MGRRTFIGLDVSKRTVAVAVASEEAREPTRYLGRLRPGSGGFDREHAAIVAEIGAIRRFATAPQFMAYPIRERELDRPSMKTAHRRSPKPATASLSHLPGNHTPTARP
jgi:hypothetical protein